MTTPRPKSKLDEVSEIIYTNPDDLYLSEFQATRFLRMTRDAEAQDFLRAKRQRMLIYYQSGQYSEARAELVSLIPYVKGNGSLYLTLIGMAVRIGAFSDLCKISNNLDAEAVLSLPQNYRSPVLINISTFSIFNGRFKESIMNLNYLIEKLKLITEDLEHANFDEARNQMESFSDAYDGLNLDSSRVKQLTATLEEFIVQHKIRVFGTMISIPDGEFLIDLGTKKPVQEIIQLNDDLFNLVFERGVIDEFNIFSINFSPVTEEQLKDALM